MMMHNGNTMRDSIRGVHTQDLDYDLPPGRIAVSPAEPRDAARLMLCRRGCDVVTHHHIRDLPQLVSDGRPILQSGDLMVANHTRVAPALLTLCRAATGGHVEGLFLAKQGNHPEHWRLMLKSGGRLQPGESLTLDEQASLTLLTSHGRGEWTATLHANTPGLEVLQRLGRPPLPPYIRKARRDEGQPELTPRDAERYNTVYADPADVGRSVAAPTAGLHFTPALLDQLTSQGIHHAPVHLDVGVGTFRPIATDRLEQHAMHREHLTVPQPTRDLIAHTRAQRGRLLAIGTTTVRALESLPAHWQTVQGDYTADTDLFIHPDAEFTWRFTDALLTNFHLPRSSLIALVGRYPT